MPFPVAILPVPAGTVKEIRLLVTDGTIRATSAPNVRDLKIPLSCDNLENTRVIRMVPASQPGFVVAAGAKTVVDVSFNANTDLTPIKGNRIVEPTGKPGDEGIQWYLKTTLQGVQKPASTDPLIPQIILLQFKSGVSDSDKASVEQSVGGTVLRRDGNYEDLRVTDDMQDALDTLTSNDNVASALPETNVFPEAIPNDEASQQWYLGADKINATGAWNTQTGSRNMIIAVIGTGIDLGNADLANNVFINEGELPSYFTQADQNGHKAADFDGDGIITYHDFNSEVPSQHAAAAAFLAAHHISDLNHNGVIDPSDFLNPANGLLDGVDSDHKGIPDDISGADIFAHTNNAQDEVGHGTFVASIAAAVGNNGIGIPGIAWQARILPVKVIDPSTGGADRLTVIQGIQYAQAMHASVINISLGITSAKKGASIPAASTRNHCGEFLIENASQLAQAMSQINAEWDGANITAPIVTVAEDCAINYDSGDFITWPASLHRSNMIVVTATDENDALGPFAAFGASTVDVAAPGVDMWGLLDSDGPGSFEGGFGTSFAAPVVTGTVALMISQDPSLAGNAQVIRDRIVSTADSVGIATKNGGRIDVAKAIAGL